MNNKSCTSVPRLKVKILNKIIYLMKLKWHLNLFYNLIEPKECSQLLQITQDCLEIGGSAGDLMLPLCTLYRVCRSCVS